MIGPASRLPSSSAAIALIALGACVRRPALEDLEADAAAVDARMAVDAAGEFSLTIGSCLAANDQPCFFAAEDSRFRDLGTEGTEVSPVLGLQGTPMFVFMLRNSAGPNGVDAEEIEERPLVEMIVEGEPGTVASYEARPSWGEMADGWESRPLFLILTEDPAELEGSVLAVRATETPRGNAPTAASAQFVCGALQTEPFPDE